VFAALALAAQTPVEVISGAAPRRLPPPIGLRYKLADSTGHHWCAGVP
jgi:hypothetical protein